MGQSVIYINDAGGLEFLRVRRLPWELPSGVTVVGVEGRTAESVPAARVAAGGADVVALDRVWVVADVMRPMQRRIEELLGRLTCVCGDMLEDHGRGSYGCAQCDCALFSARRPG